ncbi:MAG TPA: hypothetical protein VH475_25590 [Tepidisphaeraceae bacterium]|jgi:hypothetical protein
MRGLIVSAVCALPIGIAGCAHHHYHEDYRERVVVAEPPPPDRVEVYGVAPSPHHYWVNGHWVRRDRGWDWRPGYWDRRPARGGGEYVQGHWVRGGRGYEYIDGHWRY